MRYLPKIAGATLFFAMILSFIVGIEHFDDDKLFGPVDGAAMPHR